MHFLCGLLVAAALVRAGVVQGVVLEHASGRPVARTVVSLYPIPKYGIPPGEPMTTRVGRAGQFVFPAVAPGAYLLIATHESFFPSAYGARLPSGRAMPILVTADSTLFAEMRLRHKGAITGRVLDENGVGAAGVPVVAYKARLPLRSERGAISDDRGVFRIYGLDPGKYWVRSGAHRLEDRSGWLPTFGPQNREVRDAKIHTVTVDADTSYADISPESGSLSSLKGDITCNTPGNITVTLSSETMVRTARTSCGPNPGSYQFEGLPQGMYEISAINQAGTAAAFAELNISGNTKMELSLMSLPVAFIDVRRAGSNAIFDIPITLTGRRQSLSETETPRELKGRDVALAPGYWELQARAPSGFCIESIVNLTGGSRRLARVEKSADAYEVFIAPRFSARIRVLVSDQCGQLAGRAMSDGKPVPGVSVFLWPVAEEARRSLGGSLETATDAEGQYRFDSLPAGEYRLLASYDVLEFDAELAQLSNAPTAQSRAMQTTSLDLPLWLAPY